MLSYGADPLLHDYSGNMPVDLATDRKMQQYFTNMLADLHGKVPTRAKSDTTLASTKVSRWNVSHCPEFYTPPATMIAKLEKPVIKKKKSDVFKFEMSTHLMPTFYQLKDREGDWVLYKDLKDYIKKYCHRNEDIRKKGELIEMKKSEFLKNSHCCELDRSKVEVRFHERSSEDIIILAKVDKFIRKVLNSDVIEVPVTI